MSQGSGMLSTLALSARFPSWTFWSWPWLLSPCAYGAHSGPALSVSPGV
jgi:hypothetical protein